MKWIFGLIILICALLTGCKTETALTKPAFEDGSDNGYGTYQYNISKDDVRTYLSALADDGWRNMDGSDISADVSAGTASYEFVKENSTLQVIVFMEDELYPGSNRMLIKHTDHINTEDIKSRMGALSKEKVLDRIQQAADVKVQEGMIAPTKGTITGLIELYIEGLYDKLGLQAYAAVSDFGFAGSFLVNRNICTYVEGDLKNACVADIDQDKEFELMDLNVTWNKGIYKEELSAYYLAEPIIYMNSGTRLLLRKYYNCLVPKNDYNGQLQLRKVDDTTVKLVEGNTDYGVLKASGTTLFVEDMDSLPYVEWARVYDQELLTQFNKETPASPPDIVIAVDGLSLDYAVSANCWDKVQESYTTAKAFAELTNKGQFIPTVQIGNHYLTDRKVKLSFGRYIPDSVQVFDEMLGDNGSLRYNLTLEQTVQILSDGSIQFNLNQHPAYALSSYSGDYERDWLRLFRVVCKWGTRECTYAFLINTGSTEALTKLADHDFLNCEGSYSQFSSSWGLSMTIDATGLPDSYIMEWQVSDGVIAAWNILSLCSVKPYEPIKITGMHNGYPMTSSKDFHDGEIIWTPITYEEGAEVTVKVYIYEKEEDKSPVAYSEIKLVNTNGVFSKK